MRTSLTLLAVVAVFLVSPGRDGPGSVVARATRNRSSPHRTRSSSQQQVVAPHHALTCSRRALEDAPKYLSAATFSTTRTCLRARAGHEVLRGRPENPIPARNAWRTNVVSVVAEETCVAVADRFGSADPAQAAARPTRTTWFTCGASRTQGRRALDYGRCAPAAGAPAPGRRQAN